MPLSKGIRAPRSESDAAITVQTLWRERLTYGLSPGDAEISRLSERKRID